MNTFTPQFICIIIGTGACSDIEGKWNANHWTWPKPKHTRKEPVFSRSVNQDSYIGATRHKRIMRSATIAKSIPMVPWQPASGKSTQSTDTGSFLSVHTKHRHWVILISPHKADIGSFLTVHTKHRPGVILISPHKAQTLGHSYQSIQSTDTGSFLSVHTKYRHWVILISPHKAQTLGHSSQSTQSTDTGSFLSVHTKHRHWVILNHPHKADIESFLTAHTTQILGHS